MRTKQLLVNELASLRGLAIILHSRADKVTCWGDLGWNKSMAYSICWEPQETQLESTRFCHSPFWLWYKQRKSAREKKPLSQDSSHSADSIIQRYPLQQRVFLRSQVHTGEEKEKNIANILQTAGYGVDRWLCVAIVKKRNSLPWQILTFFWFLRLSLMAVFLFCPLGAMKVDVIFWAWLTAKDSRLCRG